MKVTCSANLVELTVFLNPLFNIHHITGRHTLRRALVIYNLKCWRGRSQWPRGLRRRSAAERLAGIVSSNPTDGMDVCLLWVFVLSDRGLCDGPIPRPEESYRLRCVSQCDQVKINNLDTYCESVGEGRTTKRWRAWWLCTIIKEECLRHRLYTVFSYYPTTWM
jgi:hypothetical protein